MGEGLGEAGRHAPGIISALASQFIQMGGDAGQALLLARGEMARVVGRYALTLAFNDVFRLMSWIFIAALVMVPFCKPPPADAAPPVDAH
jgi:DHA2 family multidrug resistance protein